MRVVRGSWIVWVLALLALSPTAAVAHSNSVDSEPRDDARIATLPRTATVTFNEPVSEAALALTQPDGRVVTLRARVSGTVVTAPLPTGGTKGRYVLAYRVVSEDGHPVTGEVEFTVTAGNDAASPAKTTEPAPTKRWGFGVPPWGVGAGAAVLLALAGLLVRAARR
jgi:methionine-rich copper-binding protein CopC